MQKKGDIKKYKASVEVSHITVVLIENKLSETKVDSLCAHRVSVIVLLFSTSYALCPMGENYLLPVFCSLNSSTQFSHLHFDIMWTT